jgi:hypothetical protein
MAMMAMMTMRGVMIYPFRLPRIQERSNLPERVLPDVIIVLELAACRKGVDGSARTRYKRHAARIRLRATTHGWRPGVKPLLAGRASRYFA